MTIRPVLSLARLESVVTEIESERVEPANIDGPVDRMDAGALLASRAALPSGLRQPIIVSRLERDRFVHALTSDGGFAGFQLSRLSSADAAELTRLGVDVDALFARAHRDHELSGADEVNAVFEALDRIDRNDSSRSFNLSYRFGDVELETRAAKALTILLGTRRSYDVQPRAVTAMRFVQVEEGARRSPISLAVPALKQQGQTDCFDTNKRALDVYARALARKTPMDRASAPSSSNLADLTHFAVRAEDQHGHVGGAREDFVALRAYVDACLERGLPAFVGVSHSLTDNRNWDGATDHSVMIVGRGYDESGRLYYAFNDPANGGTSRFFVDEASDMLVRPGIDENTQTTWVAERSFRVTMVRTWTQLPFADVVGREPSPPASTYPGQPDTLETARQFFRL